MNEIAFRLHFWKQTTVELCVLDIRRADEVLVQHVQDDSFGVPGKCYLLPGLGPIVAEGVTADLI